LTLQIGFNLYINLVELHLLPITVAVAPILAMLAIWFVPERLKLHGKLSVFMHGISVLVAIAVYFTASPASVLPSFHWFSVGTHQVWVHIATDSYTTIMMLLVAFMSTLVQLFSLVYMKDDTALKQYFMLLGLFTFAMQVLVLSNNLLLMFLAWELVGFCSFALVGFWYRKEAAVKAARKSFLVNRAADLGFLLALLSAWQHAHTFNIDELLLHQQQGQVFPLYLGIGLLVAACGKSAQLPFSIWLPDAMQGPTPVSALMHAATMVAAGIFLLVKTFPLLPLEALDIALITGSLSALAAALAALQQFDLKKVLAYSTISQLGFMMAAIGAGLPQAAFFHLLTHAFFKAALFLCAGAISYTAKKAVYQLPDAPPDVQDMRYLGGLRNAVPHVFVVYTLAAAALAGLPFSAGFLSKELILNAVWSKVALSTTALTALVMLMFSTLLTAVYISRQWILVFMGEARSGLPQAMSQLAGLAILKPMYGVLTVLAIGALFLPFSLSPFSAEGGWLINQLPTADYPHSYYVLVLSLILSAGGIAFGWWHYSRSYFSQSGQMSNPVYYLDAQLNVLLGRMQKYLLASLSLWNYLDLMYEEKVVRTGHWLAARASVTDKKLIDKMVDTGGIFAVLIAHISAWTDRHLVDGFVNFAARFTGLGGRKVSYLQSGFIQQYFVWAVVAMLVLSVLIWRSMA
jgi:NADH-quinone oxidoreductase subunit L